MIYKKSWSIYLYYLYEKHYIKLSNQSAKGFRSQGVVKQEVIELEFHQHEVSADGFSGDRLKLSRRGKIQKW